MFEIGEYIVYGVKGVCRIEDITHIDISGADKDRLYYVLAPVGDGSGRIYAPTDNQKITMRKVISREEADQLIEDMPKIEQLWVPDDRQREARYKEAMNTCDYRAWVSIVKTLYIRKHKIFHTVIAPAQFPFRLDLWQLFEDGTADSEILPLVPVCHQTREAVVFFPVAVLPPENVSLELVVCQSGFSHSVVCK